MKRLDLLQVKSIDPGKPSHARASNIDLVLIRPTETEEVFVLYGRCQHRGALMSDGHVKGELLTCCLHGSTYNYRTGKKIHYPGADLKKFNSWIEQGSVWVDLDEIETWEQNNPQKYDRNAYQGLDGVTLIITGGLRIPADFIKALALGADAVALSNAAIQAIGCLGMRACHTNCCPVGIATQKPELRQRLPIDEAAQRLSRFLGASVELMQVMARACGHSHLQHFKNSDLSTWKESMARLAGVSFGGVGD